MLVKDVRGFQIINIHDKHTCTRKAMSTTNVVITPTTSPKTPLATVDEPMSQSICQKKQRAVLRLNLVLLPNLLCFEEGYL